MSGFSAFLDLGGYGSYIWPCYVLSFGFVVGLYLHASRHKRQLQLRIDAAIAAQAKVKK